MITRVQDSHEHASGSRRGSLGVEMLGHVLARFNFLMNQGYVFFLPSSPI